ncbi:sensor histidine kinase [Chryseobacterium indologenes]|uniref:sensor histidine kinase n=1 Tax=Chryseobacterium indologenes TaxID=253 RepID=UPI0009A216ED|nr:HAMP domain-containing sensor histidine kinase [Chryseobacterium indologenes]
MNKFFTNFGKLLFIITIIVVLVFQGYWIWVNFQNKKEEILKNTKSETAQILIQNMLNQSSIKEKLASKNTTNPDASKKVEVYITQPKTKNIINEKIKPQGNGEFYESKMLSTFLYNSLKKSLKHSFKKDVEIDIYIENKTKKKTYPNNHKITNQNTTEPINSLVENNTTYRVHIINLTEITLYEIKEILFFSVFYVLLCVITIVILFRNLNFSQKLLKNKEIFTRNMTHELKIPISTLLIAAEGLEKYNIANEPEGARKYAKSIQRASHQLSTLVEAILQNARADISTEKLSLIPINLLILLEEVKEILSDIITEKKAKIMIRDIDDSVLIKGNHDQMKQILLNLLDNSLKYSEQEPVIIISAKQNRNRILIKIEDNGIGIPEKYFQEIFKPYFRIPNGDLYDVKGFGLGLSFVKNSLKKQNGNIRIIKPESEGTVMELNMPLYES